MTVGARRLIGYEHGRSWYLQHKNAFSTPEVCIRQVRLPPTLGQIYPSTGPETYVPSEDRPQTYEPPIAGCEARPGSSIVGH
jgi:hypothetical protein